MTIKEKNLKLFKFFLELNGGDVNLKNIKNQSLLYFTASIGNNYEILNEILGNQKFDPVKSDIQNSFINSAGTESKKIIDEYDKGRLLSFDKIHLLFRLYKNENHNDSSTINKFHNSCEFFLRKMNLLPMIPSICTSLLSQNHNVYQYSFSCLTCQKSSLCEICAKVCHKGHQIIKAEGFNSHCDCDKNCKCKSIVQSVHDELYDSFKYDIYNDNDDDDESDNEEEEEKEEIKSLKCTLNLSEFNSMSQPMYCCRKCKANICCTNREQKYEIMKQRMFQCKTCGIAAQNQGICEACALQCHLGHNVVYIGIREFVLECYSMNFNCTAPYCPEISCDGLCCRLKQGKDKLFPDFVCLTCDKEGEKRLCKTWALICHKGHDFHFIEYSNFDCQCDPCQCSKDES